MYEPSVLLVVAATFVLAGTVKGVIGLGLPTVSLALLTVAIDLPSAMACFVDDFAACGIMQSSGAITYGHSSSIVR